MKMNIEVDKNGTEPMGQLMKKKLLIETEVCGDAFLLTTIVIMSCNL